MRRILLISILLLSTQAGKSQIEVTPAEVSVVDTTAWGKWHVMVPNELRVLQEQQKKRNLKSAGTPGWRVRAFRENSKNARQKSLEYVEQLKNSFPNTPIYWNYESPFFKVSLGDFRTKEEAIRFVQKNKELIPTAFVVSEAIFPAIAPVIPSLPQTEGTTLPTDPESIFLQP